MLEYARPELVEFLETVRKTGNEYWARHKPESLEDFRARGVGGSTWDENTRWMAIMLGPGVTPEPLPAVEDGESGA